MKNGLIKTVLVSTGVALISVPSYGYDVFEWTGASAQENHPLQINIPGEPDIKCGPRCITFNGSGGFELQTGLVIDNLYDASGNGPGEGSGGMGSVTECYDAEPERIVTAVGGHAFSPTPLQPAIVPENSPFLSGIPMNETNLCTDEEGKIMSGKAVYFTIVGSGLAIAYAIDFDNRLYSLFVGSGILGSGGDTDNTPSFADLGSIAASLEAGVAPTGTFGATNTWVWDWSGDMAYLTCDTDPRYSCGASAKAVPVPSYVVFALGFGMLGVTYWSRRIRRN